MTRRDRLMILAVLGVVLLGGFWMLLLKPQRKASADAQANLATAQAALTQAQQQLTTGRAAQAAFRRDRVAIVKLGRVVPETDDIPTLLTELAAVARRDDVWFSSYRTDTAGAQPTGDATTSTGTATTTSTGASGAGSTAATAPLFPPGSVSIAGGLGRTPFVIKLKGTYFNLEKYLRDVQRFAVLSAKRSTTKGRLMIVDGFTYKSSEEVVLTKFAKTKLAATKSKMYLEAELSASVYFAPPLETPSASSAAASPSAGTAVPATATSTGTAAVGGLR